jgi:hypothetical protein
MNDKDEILQFYKESYPENWFSDRMLLTNKYFGIREMHEGKPKVNCNLNTLLTDNSWFAFVECMCTLKYT